MRYNRFEPFKILTRTRELNAIAKGLLPIPIEWMVYPSNICNYSCGHCIMKEERQNRAMLSQSVMEKIVKDCEKYGIRSVMVAGGGEPLTNPHTMAMFSQLRALGVKTGIDTNGSLLEDASDIDYLRVSVDAATRETYKKVHGVDKFDEITAKLKRVNHNELGLAFLITEDNYNEIFRFCEWAQQFDYEFIHIRPAYLPGNNNLHQIVSGLAKVKDAVERSFHDVYFRTDKFDGYWTPRLYDKCRATPLKAVLTADGRFAVCQDNFIKFGDYNNESFEACWYGQEHKNALRKIDIEKCPRCVEVGYNEIIQHCFLDDKLRMDVI